MRIAFLTHEPFDPPSGGGSAEAPYLVREFRRRGHAVHLFCPTFSNEGAVAAESGVTIHAFRRWEMGRYTRARTLKYLLYPAALARHVVRERIAWERRTGTPLAFDVIVAQHTISAVAAVRLRRRFGVPVVLNYLDFLTGFMETWPAPFTRTGLVASLTHYELNLPRRHGVEGVMTVSAPLADRLARTGYPRDRLQAIQYGYDAGLFRPAAGPLPTPGAPVVVMHGSFDRHHLGDIAKESVARVHAARPEVRFRFVGRVTPELARFVSGLRAAHPRLGVETPGFIPYAEVAGQLRDAAVGIVPYEASNGTHCAFVAKAVEYLGCGIPVASTPLENLTRYFGDEPAVKFGGFGAEDFAAAVLDRLALAPAERARLGAVGAARVARELDWPVIARRATDFIEACVSRGKGAGSVAPPGGEAGVQP